MRNIREGIPSKPLLLTVDRVFTLPDGTHYVVSFVEIWEWCVVVRMVGLAEGFARRVLELGIELVDQDESSYPFMAATSGGMVLPEEVVIAFEGTPRPPARPADVAVVIRGHRLRLVLSAAAA